MVSACAASATDTTRAPTTTQGASAVAVAYLNEALRGISEHSIYTDSDWDVIESAAFEKASGAQTPADTYEAIELALRLLEDEFDLFLSPSDLLRHDPGFADFDHPEIELRSDRIGHVSLGKFLGDIGEQADAFAADLAERITATAEETCGWIVDLRTTTFGIMWPMLGGIAPLLDRGHIGGFTHADGVVEIWENTGDAVTLDGVTMASNSLTNVSHFDQPIAVLVSPVTGSPGEAVAVAFHGQPQTRLFGQNTRGHTASIDHFELSDGAIISLTTSNFSDRLGEQFGFGGPVEPDEVTPNPSATEEAAIDWLLSLPSCQ